MSAYGKYCMNSIKSYEIFSGSTQLLRFDIFHGHARLYGKEEQEKHVAVRCSLSQYLPLNRVHRGAECSLYLQIAGQG
jgi:hypothetical protein